MIDSYFSSSGTKLSSIRAAASDGGRGPGLPLKTLLITCSRAAVVGFLSCGTDVDVFLSSSPLYSSCATGASLTSFPMDPMAVQSFWKNVSRFVLSDLDFLNDFHVGLRGCASGPVLARVVCSWVMEEERQTWLVPWWRYAVLACMGQECVGTRVRPWLGESWHWRARSWAGSRDGARGTGTREAAGLVGRV